MALKGMKLPSLDLLKNVLHKKNRIPAFMGMNYIAKFDFAFSIISFCTYLSFSHENYDINNNNSNNISNYNYISF